MGILEPAGELRKKTDSHGNRTSVLVAEPRPETFHDADPFGQPAPRVLVFADAVIDPIRPGMDSACQVPHLVKACIIQ